MALEVILIILIVIVAIVNIALCACWLLNTSYMADRHFVCCWCCKSSDDFGDDEIADIDGPWSNGRSAPTPPFFLSLALSGSPLRHAATVTRTDHQRRNVVGSSLLCAPQCPPTATSPSSRRRRCRPA